MKAPVIDTCITNESPLIQKIDTLTKKVIRKEFAKTDTRQWGSVTDRMKDLPNIKEEIYEHLRNKELTPLSNGYDINVEDSPINRLIRNLSYQLEYEDGASEQSYINAVDNTIQKYIHEINQEEEQSDHSDGEKEWADERSKEIKDGNVKKNKDQKAGREGSEGEPENEDLIKNKEEAVKQILKFINKNTGGQKKSIFKKITKTSQVIKVSAVKRVMPLFKKELATKNLWARIKEPSKQLSLIIDNSGSMCGYVGTVNDLLLKLAKTNTVTAYIFNSAGQIVAGKQMDKEFKITNKESIKKFNYNPGGCDNLYEAIKYGILHKKEKTLIVVTDYSTDISSNESHMLYRMAQEHGKEFIIVGIDAKLDSFSGILPEHLICVKQLR